MKGLIQGSIALMLLAPAPARAQEMLTLSGALRTVSRSSLQAETGRLASATAAAETREVKSYYLPEISLNGGHLNLDQTPSLKFGPVSLGPITLGPSLPQLGPFTFGPLATPVADKSSWRYKLAVDYLVYDFGRRSKALAASRSKEEAVALGSGEAVKRTQAEVASRYLALLNIKAQKRVVAQRRQALQDHLRTVNDLYKQGIVARNDVLRTEVALRTVEDADRALDNGYASALEALNVAMGLEATKAWGLPEELPPPPPMPWDEAACRSKAASSNDGVKALGAKIKALDDQVAYRKRDFAPNLVAEASHSYEQNSYTMDNHTNALYLGLSWKVFDGGARSSKVRASESERDQARRERLEAQRKAESAAAASLRSFRVALQEAETARTNVSAAEENFRIVEDQYKEGLVRSTDALDAEAILAESRFSLVDKHYRAYSQQAGLLAILGEDMPAFYDNLPIATKPLEK